MYDLRVELSSGSYADASTLRSVVASIPHANDVAATSVRLEGPIQIDASSAERTLLVPGAVVGIDLSHGEPDVSSLAVLAGRNLRSRRPRQARRGARPPLRRATTTCRRTARSSRRAGAASPTSGQGLTPDYFVVLGAQQTQETAADYAVLFTSIETAQRLLGHPGQANELDAARALARRGRAGRLRAAPRDQRAAAGCRLHDEHACAGSRAHLAA